MLQTGPPADDLLTDGRHVAVRLVGVMGKNAERGRRRAEEAEKLGISPAELKEQRRREHERNRARKTGRAASAPAHPARPAGSGRPTRSGTRGRPSDGGNRDRARRDGTPVERTAPSTKRPPPPRPAVSEPLRSPSDPYVWRYTAESANNRKGVFGFYDEK
jgi:hypothetical protein